MMSQRDIKRMRKPGCKPPRYTKRSNTDCFKLFACILQFLKGVRQFTDPRLFKHILIIDVTDTLKVYRKSIILPVRPPSLF